MTAQKRATGAAEASGRTAKAASWQGVRAAALDLVERFCARMGMEPAQFLSAQGWMGSGEWQRAVDWRSLANTSFDNYVRQNLGESGGGLNRLAFTRGLENRGAPAGRAPESRKGTGQKETARPRPGSAGQAAEARRPAPARQETFVYSVEYGILDGPQGSFTFTTTTPITDYSERWLASALRNPPAGFSAMERGAPMTPERRVALAAELELRASDPIGTFAISRLNPPERRSGG